MKSVIATVIVGSLVLGSAGFALAQGNPPVNDPTAGSTQTPPDKMSKKEQQPKTTTGSSSRDDVKGSGEVTAPAPR